MCTDPQEPASRDPRRKRGLAHRNPRGAWPSGARSNPLIFRGIWVKETRRDLVVNNARRVHVVELEAILEIRLLEDFDLEGARGQSDFRYGPRAARTRDIPDQPRPSP